MKFQKYSLLKKTAVVGVALAGLLSAIPVFAQTNGSPTYVPPISSTTRPFGGRGRMSSSTMMMMREARQASTTAAHVLTYQNRGNNLIDQRITSLNSLIARIQGMKFVSSGDVSSLEASLNSIITSLTNLKGQIDTDTSTTSLKSDDQSITQAYRVYMLVQPQAEITASADRILNIVSSFNTIVSKINSRLASSTTASSNSTVQSALSDIATQLSDATTQANAATSEVSGLVPDDGNTTVAASNTAALKDARAKLGVAQKDLITARKDVQTIVTALK